VRVTELMKQKQYAPMSVAEMALTLYAGTNGYFDKVTGARSWKPRPRCSRLRAALRRSPQRHRGEAGSDQGLEASLRSAAKNSSPRSNGDTAVKDTYGRR